MPSKTANVVILFNVKNCHISFSSIPTTKLKSGAYYSSKGIKLKQKLNYKNKIEQLLQNE